MQTVAELVPDSIDDLSDHKPIEIELVDGQQLDISQMSAKQLVQLQCEQEPAFARNIAQSQKDSHERQHLTTLAYTSICKILERQSQEENATSEFSMGMDRRYSDLLLRLMKRQSSNGLSGGLFEVGFSSGVLLQTIANEGFDVGGLEVVDGLFQQAKAKLESKHHERIVLGDFRKVDLSEHRGRYSVVFWNDVFEHIPTDEILDYLVLINSLLCEGGLLVTITPNWHMRPSDVTVDFCPPRTEAIGFHLKEYTLGDVCGLLRDAGFRSVQTPTYVSRRKIYVSRFANWTPAKIALEPTLEWLPFSLAVQACRRFGLNCTIATK